MSHRSPLHRIILCVGLITSMLVVPGGCGLISSRKNSDSSNPAAIIEAMTVESDEEPAEQLLAAEESLDNAKAATSDLNITDVEAASTTKTTEDLPPASPAAVAPVGKRFPLLKESLFSVGPSAGLTPGRNRHEAEELDNQQLAMSEPITSPAVPLPIEQVDSASFREVVLESEIPVMVDFYADWCGPCKLVAPELEQFARAQGDVRVVKVNVDHDKTLAKSYRVRSYPTVIVFEQGTPVAHHVGLDNIRRALRR